MIVTNSYGPRPPLNDKSQGDLPGPTLQKWSDFAFVCLATACEGDRTCMRRLPWVVRYDTRNKVTHDNLLDLLMEEGKSLGPWSEKTIYAAQMNTSAGMWMLGTPNGYDIAWLLASHADMLGGKTVDYVDLFQAGATQGGSLAFHVTGGALPPSKAS